MRPKEWADLLVVAGLFTLLFCSLGNAWLDGSKLKRIPDTITNRNDTQLIYAAIPFNITWQAGMAVDFSDLEVGCENGTGESWCPHVITRYNDSATAYGYVNITRPLPASPGTLKLNFYFSGGGTNYSDGDRVFISWDNFTNTSVSAPAWSYSGATYYWNTTDKSLQVKQLNPSYAGPSTQPTLISYTAEADIYFLVAEGGAGSPWNYAGVCGYQNAVASTAHGHCGMGRDHADDFDISHTSVDYGPHNYPCALTDHKLYHLNASFTPANITATLSDLSGTECYSSIVPVDTTGYYSLGSVDIYHMAFKNFIVRGYYNIEPTHSWGAVETATGESEAVDVGLFEPQNGAWNTSQTLPYQFSYNLTATSAGALGAVHNCSLLMNKSGTWQTVMSNSSAIGNNTLYGFSYNSGEDGYWLWNVNCSTENRSNYTASSNRSIGIDTVAPVATWDSPGNLSTWSIPVPFSISYTDGHFKNCTLEISGLNYSMSESGGACTYSYSPALEENFLARAWVFDQAGQSAYIAWYNISYDILLYEWAVNGQFPANISYWENYTWSQTGGGTQQHQWDASASCPFGAGNGCLLSSVDSSAAGSSTKTINTTRIPLYKLRDQGMTGNQTFYVRFNDTIASTMPGAPFVFRAYTENSSGGTLKYEDTDTNTSTSFVYSVGANVSGDDWLYLTFYFSATDNTVGGARYINIYFDNMSITGPGVLTHANQQSLKNSDGTFNVSVNVTDGYGWFTVLGITNITANTTCTISGTAFGDYVLSYDVTSKRYMATYVPVATECSGSWNTSFTTVYPDTLTTRSSIVRSDAQLGYYNYTNTSAWPPLKGVDVRLTFYDLVSMADTTKYANNVSGVLTTIVSRIRRPTGDYDNLTFRYRVATNDYQANYTTPNVLCNGGNCMLGTDYTLEVTGISTPGYDVLDINQTRLKYAYNISTDFFFALSGSRARMYAMGDVRIASGWIALYSSAGSLVTRQRGANLTFGSLAAGSYYLTFSMVEGIDDIVTPVFTLGPNNVDTVTAFDNFPYYEGTLIVYQNGSADLEARVKPQAFAQIFRVTTYNISSGSAVSGVNVSVTRKAWSTYSTSWSWQPTTTWCVTNASGVCDLVLPASTGTESPPRYAYRLTANDSRFLFASTPDGIIGHPSFGWQVLSQIPIWLRPSGVGAGYIITDLQGTPGAVTLDYAILRGRLFPGIRFKTYNYEHYAYDDQIYLAMVDVYQDGTTLVASERARLDLSGNGWTAYFPPFRVPQEASNYTLMFRLQKYEGGSFVDVNVTLLILDSEMFAPDTYFWSNGSISTFSAKMTDRWLYETEPYSYLHGLNCNVSTNGEMFSLSETNITSGATFNSWWEGNLTRIATDPTYTLRCSAPGYRAFEQNGSATFTNGTLLQCGVFGRNPGGAVVTMTELYSYGGWVYNPILFCIASVYPHFGGQAISFLSDNITATVDGEIADISVQTPNLLSFSYVPGAIYVDGEESYTFVVMLMGNFQTIERLITLPVSDIIDRYVRISSIAFDRTTYTQGDNATCTLIVSSLSGSVQGKLEVSGNQGMAVKDITIYPLTRNYSLQVTIGENVTAFLTGEKRSNLTCGMAFYVNVNNRTVLVPYFDTATAYVLKAATVQASIEETLYLGMMWTFGAVYNVLKDHPFLLVGILMVAVIGLLYSRHKG